MIVAIEVGDQLAHLDATDLDGTSATLSPYSLPGGRGSDVRVTRFGYAEPLAELDLRPGALTLAPTNAAISRPLPAPTLGIESLTILDGVASSWVSSTRSPLLEVQLTVPCAAFDVTLARLPTDDSSHLVFIVPWSDDEVLVEVQDGQRAQKTFRIRATGEFFPFRLDTSDSGPLRSAFEAPDGDLWFGSAGGKLWKLEDHVEGAKPTLVATATVSEELRWGAPAFAANGSLESLVVMTTEGSVVAFDENLESRLLARVEPDRELRAGDHKVGAASRSESGVVTLVREDFGQVVRVDDGRLETFDPLPDVLGGFPAAAEVPGIGTVVSAGLFGDIVVYDGAWRELGSAPGGRNSVEALFPFRRGFLAGSVNGWVAEYYSPYGFCSSTLTAADSTHRIVQRGDYFFFAGAARFATLPVSILKLR